MMEEEEEKRRRRRKSKRSEWLRLRGSGVVQLEKIDSGDQPEPFWLIELRNCVHPKHPGEFQPVAAVGSCII